MIRVAWLASTPRLRTPRRTTTYTPRRRRQPRPVHQNTGRTRETSYNGDMIFDQPPRELPVATLQSRDSKVRFAMATRQWLVARWSWFRPRAIPVVVAFAGMLAVLASANYLRRLARETPEQLTVQRRAPPSVATLPTMRLDVPAPSTTTAPSVAREHCRYRVNRGE